MNLLGDADPRVNGADGSIFDVSGAVIKILL